MRKRRCSFGLRRPKEEKANIMNSSGNRECWALESSS